MPQPNSLTPQFVWNEKLRRYQDAETGRIVSKEQVRAALDAVILASKKETYALTQKLIDGKITIAEWQMEMAQRLKIQTLASAALAKGGWAQMTASDFGKVGADLKKQYAFLKQFAKDIASGKVNLDGRAVLRAGLYTESARTVFEKARRDLLIEQGFDRERRVLGIADHCKSCVIYARRGWRPIGTLPMIGEKSLCMTNCHCSFEYGKAIEDAGI